MIEGFLQVLFVRSFVGFFFFVVFICGEGRDVCGKY